MNKKFSLIKVILIALTVISSVKMIFFGWVIDEGYAFAIGNRLLQGDLLFRDMWELHQTSGYAIEFFLWVYHLIFGSAEGEIVFVRACGMAIHLMVSYALYRALRRHISEEKAFIAAVLYANLSPKSISTPEFSNLLNQTSVLTLICLDKLYVEAVKKKRLMTALAAGVFLALCVMSYPPSLIFAAFVFVYVFLKSKGRRKEFAAVSGVCLVSGILYMARIFSYMSAGELKESIHMMLASDVTHGGGFSKIPGYGKDTLIILIFIAGFYGLSYLISGLLKKKELLVPLAAVMVFAWRNIHILLRNDTYPVEYTFAGILIVLLIAFYGGIREKLYSEEDKKVMALYAGGSGAVFLTVLVACNQSVFSSAKYLTVGFAVIFVMSVNAEVIKSAERVLFLAGAVLLIFINIFQYGNPRNRLFSIFDAEARVPKGPGRWLILERMFANKARIDSEELPEALAGADYVMITGDAAAYLYTDARIGHGTTIMTENYGESYARYWEAHPEKSPDIIAIECYNGSPDAVVANSWLYEYLEGDFGASEVVNTTYYRLYIK